MSTLPELPPARQVLPFQLPVNGGISLHITTNTNKRRIPDVRHTRLTAEVNI